MKRRTAPTTEGIFTTQKLQALLDAHVRPGIKNRRVLADVLSQAGEGISVHGIDAWFKSTDSNYAIARDSLNPHRPSYPIPKRRWVPLFELFGLEVDNLSLDDEAFRRWCFATARSRGAGSDAEPKRQVVVTGSFAMQSYAAAVNDALRDSGYEVTWLASEQDCEGDALTVLASSTAVLYGLPSTGTAFDEGVLRRARTHRVPIFFLGSHVTIPVPPAYGDCAVALCDGAWPEFLDTVMTSLAALPRRQTGHANGYAWQAPTLVTDRPSIAVLPFQNHTGTAANDVIGDSITEDLITLLSRIPEFFVISRWTTQAYKGATPDPRVVSKQLGVRYVLEGSLRSDGRVLRVTAQLVDALNGRELWASKFDQVVASPFAVQDDITRAICAQLEPQMRLDDIAYGNRSGSVQSWRLWQEGWYDLFVDAPMPVPVRSLELFRKSLALDPNYPLAHAGVAIALSTGMLWGGISPDEIPVVRHHAEWAYKRLPENPAVLYAMAMLSFIQPMKMNVALEYVSKAVDLEPSNPLYRAVRGYLVANLGAAQDGVDECLRALRLSPKDSREPFICYMLGNAYIANGQYELAIETMTRCREFSVVDFIWIMLAFSHTQLGDTQCALECLRSIEKPRSLRFYKWSIRERLWLTLPNAEKERFVALLSSVVADE